MIYSWQERNFWPLSLPFGKTTRGLTNSYEKRQVLMIFKTGVSFLQDCRKPPTGLSLIQCP